MIRRAIVEHREIALVLAIFVALAILYSVTTPLFEAPDEQWHFAFVQNVATGHGLPVQTIDKPTHLARQEGSQPPLYYLLAAATTFWINTSDYPGIVWENPHYGYNVPGIVNDNKNLFIHTSLESFPYHGTVLAIHLARLLSILMGALAVLFTYLLTLEIFPDKKYLAAGAAAVVAFVPQFLFISSAVSNDSAIVALCALSLWMMVRMLKDGGRKIASSAILLGIVTGLAALAKVSGLGLAILGVLVLAWVSFRTSESDAEGRGFTLKNGLLPRSSAFVRVLIPFGLAFVAVAGWWYARNLVLYGELTGTAMMVRIFGARETPLTMIQLLTQLREVWETFWVGFGWGNIRANPVVYTIIGIVVALSGLSLMRFLIFAFRLPITKDRNSPSAIRNSQILILVIWSGVAFIELLNWMEMTQAPHGRLFFPALPALAPLAVFGLTQWVPQRAQSILARGIAVPLVAFAAYAPFGILQPAYAYPTPLTASDIQNLPHRVDINYGGKLELLGYDIAPNRALPGGSVTLTLYWRSLAQMSEDYSIGIHLLDTRGRVIGARDSYPGHGMLPTRLWYAGQMIRDTYWLPVSPDASAPNVARVQVSLYQLETKRELPAFDPQGQAVTPLFGMLKVASTNHVAPRPQMTTNFVFDRKIALVGYDLNASQGLNLTLYWKRLAPITEDYTVFVHVVDARGKIVAQQDQQPDNGADPTSLWDDGEVVVDHYAFNLPSDPHGAYHIDLGLYRAPAGARLPVADSNGNALGDHVTLEVGR